MLQYLLSFLIFIPLVASLIVVSIPENLKHVYKYIAFTAVLFQLFIALYIYFHFTGQPGTGTGVNIENDFLFSEKISWINMDLGMLGKLSIDYFLAVDGLSVSLVLLATFVLLIGVISSWGIRDKLKGYFALYLLLSSSVVGCFIALDFFLFYLFFEFMLLPMYFLIGLWGGPRREYASIKFFLYTLAGSIFILIAIIALYLSVIDPAKTVLEIGLASSPFDVTTEMLSEVQSRLSANQINPENMVHTFNMISMTDSRNFIPGSLLSLIENASMGGVSLRLWIFLALFIGFMIKLPAVPFHTWLPDAHVEAPTPISVVLAGILLKIGGYGLIRTAFSIFPEGVHHFSWWIGLIGIISIIYGAMNALAMSDLKKLIAYSSVSHMGFVMLGLASLTVEGVNGAIYQMFSHGIITSMLFLITGVLYERTHDRKIENYGGLAQVMPYFTVVVVMAFFASLGLPGFSGFIAELLVFLGSFKSASVNELLPRWMAILATSGLILSAAYYLWTLQRMFFGKLYIRKADWKKQLTDLTAREYLMFIPLLIASIAFGIFPHLLLNIIGGSVNRFVVMTNQAGLENLLQLMTGN
ncbi:NADH-quinone oxidoreductase subunit M [soil metagenome]